MLQNLMAMNGGAMLGLRGARRASQHRSRARCPGVAPRRSRAQIPGFPPILGGGPAPAGVALLQGAELLGSLTRIQHGDVSVVAGGDLPLAATLIQPGTTNVLRELKGTSLGDAAWSRWTAMTLDIVAMLFDQIFGDDNIPGGHEGADRPAADPDAEGRHPRQELLLQEDPSGAQAARRPGRDRAWACPPSSTTSSPLYRQLDSGGAEAGRRLPGQHGHLRPAARGAGALRSPRTTAGRGRSQDASPSASSSRRSSSSPKPSAQQRDPAARRIRQHPARGAQVPRRAVGQAAAGGACQARRRQRCLEDARWRPWTC